jgi:hypothetical protein
VNIGGVEDELKPPPPPITLATTAASSLGSQQSLSSLASTTRLNPLHPRTGVGAFEACRGQNLQGAKAEAYYHAVHLKKEFW